jgi:2,3-bisphosphoglycerate-independent phosphoglycerate mutase
MNRLWATQAHTEVDASGEAVGLAPGVMGNSEVGHLTIGAGRVIYQDVMRITKAIETGTFFCNEVMLGAMKRAARDGRTLHLWGLLSDGSVHSHIDHLIALIEMAAHEGVVKIAVHAVLDGRDKPPRSALPFIDRVEAKLKELGRGRIATVTGRYFAMDRDKRWDRVERAWRAFVLAEGRRRRARGRRSKRRMRRTRGTSSSSRRLSAWLIRWKTATRSSVTTFAPIGLAS